MDQYFTIENFKRFSNKELPLNNGATVIVGKSGTGKTSLIWAYLLYFFVHNYAIRMKNEYKRVFHLCIHVPQYLHLFNPSADCFSRDLIKHKTNSAIFTRKINNVPFTFEITGNILTDNCKENLGCRIAFEYMEPTYIFLSDQKGNIMEEKYFNLDHDTKNILLDCLRELFPNFRDITTKVYNSSYTTVVYEDDDSITLKHSGNSFQKVFAALILFFTLVERDANAKYYLIDEFETNLDDAEKFFECLLRLSRKYNIKLIATTRPNTLKYLTSIDTCEIISLD